VNSIPKKRVVSLIMHVVTVTTGYPILNKLLVLNSAHITLFYAHATKLRLHVLYIYILYILVVKKKNI